MFPLFSTWCQWLTASTALQTMCFMLNTCFPSGTVEFGHMLGRGCSQHCPLVKTTNADPLVGFLGQKHHNMLLPVSSWGKSTLCAPSGKGCLNGHLKTPPCLLPQPSCAFLIRCHTYMGHWVQLYAESWGSWWNWMWRCSPEPCHRHDKQLICVLNIPNNRMATLSTNCQFSKVYH